MPGYHKLHSDRERGLLSFLLKWIIVRSSDCKLWGSGATLGQKVSQSRTTLGSLFLLLWLDATVLRNLEKKGSLTVGHAPVLLATTSPWPILPPVCTGGCVPTTEIPITGYRTGFIREWSFEGQNKRASYV